MLDERSDVVPACQEMQASGSSTQRSHLEAAFSEQELECRAVGAHLILRRWAQSSSEQGRESRRRLSPRRTSGCPPNLKRLLRVRYPLVFQNTCRLNLDPT